MMKKTWSDWFDENAGTADCTTSWHDDRYDAIATTIGAKAICSAKKPGDREINITDLQNNLANIGVELVELRQEYGEPMEIAGRIINPLLISSRSIRPTLTNPTCKPHPKKVIFSGPATTILWKDGTKTTVKCQGDDVFNSETGIALCYLKKMLGNKGNYNNIFREAIKTVEFRPTKEKGLEYGEVRSLSDVLDQMADISEKINDVFKKRNGGK